MLSITISIKLEKTLGEGTSKKKSATEKRKLNIETRGEYKKTGMKIFINILNKITVIVIIMSKF